MKHNVPSPSLYHGQVGGGVLLYIIIWGPPSHRTCMMYIDGSETANLYIDELVFEHL